MDINEIDRALDCVDEATRLLQEADTVDTQSWIKLKTARILLKDVQCLLERANAIAPTHSQKPR